MCVQKTDGTYALTRAAEIDKITFLSIADPDKVLIVATATADPIAVLMKNQPEVTILQGKLLVSSKFDDTPVEIEINDITEIKFGETTSLSAPGKSEGIVCMLQPGAALFRDIPKGLNAQVCTVDGRSVPVPACVNGELRLSREAIGTGIYIVRIGTFTTKITL